MKRNLNLSGICPICHGPCDTWKACCSLRCRDKAKLARRRVREANVGAAEAVAESPLVFYPVSSSSDIQALADLLVSDPSFESPVWLRSEAPMFPEVLSLPPSILLETLSDGMGKLSRKEV